jgi:L-asparaginase
VSGIVVVTTGGTIASQTAAGGGAQAALSGTEVLAPLPPGVRRQVTEVVEVCKVNGWNVAPADMVRVAAEVRRCIEAGADGVVVTHGTDTLEETAFVVDLFCRHLTDEVPIVFTGAMLAADALGADGMRNLAGAIAVASAPRARGRGVLVLVHEEIHTGRWITKTRATGMRPFQSPGGPVGHLVEERLVMYSEGGGELAPACAGAPALAGGVHLVLAETGGTGDEVAWRVGQGARGIVLVGTGAGNVPGTYVPAVQGALDAGVPVVITSRTLGATAPIYGGPGGNATLRGLGVVDGQGLSPGKARLALMARLATADTTEPLTSWMERL